MPDILATDTPAPPSAVDATVTATPDAAITISSIQETGPGRAIVNWDAYGNFPFGYSLVWTTEQRKPVYPDDTSTYTGDQYARSALMSGVPGYVYIVRVCRTTATGCDIYSDAAFFTFTNFAPTPTINRTQTAVAKTAIANIGSGGGGGGGNTSPTAASKFEIVSMSASSDLKAQMTWTSDSSPADGFRIFYSTTNQEPKAGSDAYYVIADGKARDAYLAEYDSPPLILVRGGQVIVSGKIGGDVDVLVAGAGCAAVAAAAAASDAPRASAGVSKRASIITTSEIAASW